jgi:glycerol uptake facilitator-like aquaporin
MTAAFALSRRLAAEALGTGFLVATVVGSRIMADALSEGVSDRRIACTAMATPDGLAMGPAKSWVLPRRHRL